MACDTLKQGLDLTCRTIHRKYVQKAVLMNYEDLLDYYFYDYPIAYFRLKEGATGYAIEAKDISENITGSWAKVSVKNVDYYRHTISFPIVGVGVLAKRMLNELDKGKYFAALKFNDGTIEVYGLQYGLTVPDYTYTAQNEQGGGQIQLDSKDNEYYPPLVYDTETGLISAFDNLFVNNGDPLPTYGSYNNDYNNDYTIDS